MRIGSVHVAIATEHIQEVFETDLITRLPQSPKFILGLINLRGNVVPVLDLWSVTQENTTTYKIVILDSTEGVIGLLIHELIDLMRFTSIHQTDTIPEPFTYWKNFFPTFCRTDKDFFIMKVNEIVLHTITLNMEQVVQ